jgi:3-oxoadipate enol-lactonase
MGHMFVRTARLASGTVRYLEAGTGTPLVLLHAFPLAADQWLPQLMAPPEGWRLIAPDLRGFGGSPPATDPTSVTIDTYAADVFELLTQLGLEQAAVAGLSMGGYVALAMMESDPSRISRLVLADTRATADTAEGQAGRDRMVSLVRREGPAGIAREMLPKLLGGTSARQQPDLVTVVRRMIESNGAHGIEGAILAMKTRPDRSALLSIVDCPTVVICGSDDVITKPEECEAMSRAIPGARFVRIDDAAHLANLEQSVAFAAALT